MVDFGAVVEDYDLGCWGGGGEDLGGGRGGEAEVWIAEVAGVDGYFGVGEDIRGGFGGVSDGEAVDFGYEGVGEEAVEEMTAEKTGGAG